MSSCSKLECIELSVRPLLNRLTTENFDSVSVELVEWANKSEHETDACTLKHVAELLIERVVSPETEDVGPYASLCEILALRTSAKVQCESIVNENTTGPTTGGWLFLELLMNAYTEVDDAYRNQDQAGDWEEVKRRHLVLTRLLGELFKRGLIIEGGLRANIDDLLADPDLDDDDTESACALLMVAGSTLDTAEERAAMDGYIDRLMERLLKTKSSRVQLSLLVSIYNTCLLLVKRLTSNCRPSSGFASAAGFQLTRSNSHVYM